MAAYRLLENRKLKMENRKLKMENRKLKMESKGYPAINWMVLYCTFILATKLTVVPVGIYPGRV
jgi:hypothetical protein